MAELTAQNYPIETIFFHLKDYTNGIDNSLKLTHYVPHSELELTVTFANC